MKPPRTTVKTVLRVLRSVRADSRGATAIEYGLIASIIVVGVIAAISSVGSVTSGMWNSTSSKVAAVTPK